MDAFAEQVRALVACVDAAAGQPLELRVRAVSAALAAVYASGGLLPAARPGRPGGQPPLDRDAWPGFGSYERYWTVGSLVDPGPPAPAGLSDALWFVLGALWAGLEAFDAGDEQRALAAWGGGFDEVWGPPAIELLHALHPRVAAYRADARQAARASRRGPPNVVTLTAPAARPVLGVRFAPCDAGVEVLDVHPRGPAAGLLARGDVVFEVDGAPLSALASDAAGARLVGAVGEPRRYGVLRDGEAWEVVLQAVDAGELG